jgi:hypothetical protein
MLQVTPEEIDRQEENLDSGHIPAALQSRLARLMRRFPGGETYPKFKPQLYPSLAERLAALSGEDAQEAMAISVHIEDTGQDRNTVKIGGVSIDPETDRVDWVEALFALTFEAPAVRTGMAVVNPPRCCAACFSDPCRCAGVHARAYPW